MSNTKFFGTGVAIVTPFHDDGSVDFASLEKLINYQIAHGIDYLVVLGTTGESVTLSKDEKRAIVSFAVEKVDNRIPLMVGVGGNNTAEIIHALETMDTTGVDAILSVAPYYNKPNQEGLYQHFKAVLTASPLPVVLYNVPGRTGSNMSADTTLRLAEMKNAIAIKEASGNMSQIMKIMAAKPKDFLVISGDDSITVPLICMGGAGVISVAANAAPAKVSQMVKLALQGDYAKARELHFCLLEFMESIFAEGSPGGIKAALHSLKLCKNVLRLPLVPVSQNLYDKLAKQIKELA